MAQSSWGDSDIGLLESVYQLLCLSRFNAIYYEMRLANVRVVSFWMEISIAATASGSGLASLMSENGNSYIHWAWSLMAVLAAAAAIIRPIYAPSSRIEALARQHQGYTTNYFNLSKLAFSIRQQAVVASEHRRRYETLYERHIQLATDAKMVEDEASPNTRLKTKARRLTDQELAPSGFWWPAELRSPPPKDNITLAEVGGRAA